MSPTSFRRVTACIALACMACAWTASAATAQTKEYKLKARMIAMMVGYVAWPKGTFDAKKQPGAKKPVKPVFELAVVGDNPFGSTLRDALKKKKPFGCTIRIRYFGKWKKMKAAERTRLRSSHALYISRSETANAQAIGTYLRKTPVWILSDSPGLARKGTHVNFFLAKNKVRFETNSTRSTIAGIRMSSKLLRLGRRVDK